MKAILLSSLLLLAPVSARKWTDVVSPTVRDPMDGNGVSYLIRTDPFFRDQIFLPPDQRPETGSPVATTEFPTYGPTTSPTFSPTTDSPSMQPSMSPSREPSMSPTETPDPYPSFPVPQNPPRWYFNYDTSDTSTHGPGEMGLVNVGGTMRVGVKNNEWGSVRNPPGFYWTEFTNQGSGAWKGVLQNRNVNANLCEVGRFQSPIDLRPSGAICHEFHEVRSLAGDYRISSSSVQKQIYSNKLRLKYARRPCGDLNDEACQEPDPPHADFPNGWGGFADVLHVDFKVKAEHRIEGEEFDAEMQIFHIHAGRRRLPTQSVLIRAKEGGYNPYFQLALDQFQFLYDVSKRQCTLEFRKERKLRAEVHDLLGVELQDGVDYTSLNSFSIDQDDPDLQEDDRDLQNRSWDPHHPMLIPTIHFWRYDGSLTEPPCGEWVTWFVADKPMIIDFRQLEQLKTIQFTHYDQQCHQPSVHFEHSVARPIRPSAGRAVWKCTAADFGPDP